MTDAIVRQLRHGPEVETLLALREEVYRNSYKIPPSSEERCGALSDPGYFLFGVFVDEVLVGGFKLRAIKPWDRVSEFWMKTKKSRRPSLPPLHLSVEVSGLFLVPEARSRDVLISIFRKIHETLRTIDRPHLVILTEAEFLPLYRRIGFKPSGLECEKRQMRSTERLLVLVATQKRFGVWGLGATPINWAVFALPLLIHSQKDSRLRDRIGMGVGDWMLMFIYLPLTLAGIWRWRKTRHACGQAESGPASRITA